MKLHRPRPGPWWTALLLLALCGTQILGAAHRALHGSQGDTTSLLTAALPADAAGRQIGAPDPGVGEGARSEEVPFFGHSSQQSGECRLFDQLVHGDSLRRAVAAPVAVDEPVAVAALPVTQLQGVEPCGYRARGPPTIG